ncbi:MAG: biotin--[acetyl-CoA-carboxylase] ligase [Burkholderiales bacterium]|nr:biotin--[acetyl-CoA-carboxylase] ligase [Burkholderiales bacterium]
MKPGGRVLQWPAEAIWEAVAPTLPGFTVEVLPSIDSTNTELMRRARAVQAEPVLLVAETQTAGRGRLGRAWQGATPADVGATLTFSLGLPLQMADWSGLSLAVGVSVVQSLHPDLQLKWPNDVWLHDRKLAGILIETANNAPALATAAAGTLGQPGGAGIGPMRYAVIGVGINIGPRTATGLATPPAWLQELEPGIDAPAALLRVAAPLVQAVQRFEAQGFAAFQAAFLQRDALAGRSVSLSDGTQGLAQGVDGSGALLVHTSAGLTRVSSAEVSVRPST